MNRLLTIWAIVFVLTGIHPALAQEDTEPVKRLKALYASDATFQQKVKLAFENLQNMPHGEPNPWQGKTVEDLYTFFNDWFYFLPNASNGLDYIMHFSWLYYQNPDGLKLVREEPGMSWTKFFVEQRGKYMDSEASVANLNLWLSDPGTKIEEFIVPEGGFTSFNDFFIREVKPGARPIDGVTDHAVVVSPADCVLNMINNDIKAESQIPLKGRMSLNIDQLLGGSRYAERFIGGTAMACFLLPDAYHHYHAPVTGQVVESREDAGHLYFGVQDLPGMANRGNPGYNQDFSVFEQFRHGYFIIETIDHGYVAMVPVGLNTIGSLVFEEPFKEVTEEQRLPLFKGEKLGHFAYGGSLVIMVFEPNRLESIKTLQGQQIGIMH